MTGWASLEAACYACGQLFLFTSNPHKVPSIEGEPVCALCIARANVVRAEHGLAPIEVLAGAYEPCEESEL